MKVYLLSHKALMEDCWYAYFGNTPDVAIVCDNLDHFLKSTIIDCVVSPANSYGLMDGGFDLAISEYFGWGLQERVQRYILEHFKGEQPVATSFIIETGKDNIRLIHTPTMRIPFPVKDPMIVYQCMRTTLMKALENRIDSIVIPAFCGECGDVSPKVIAYLMYEAYKQVFNPPEALDWDYALRWSPKLQYVMEPWKIKEPPSDKDNRT